MGYAKIHTSTIIEVPNRISLTRNFIFFNFAGYWAKKRIKKAELEQPGLFTPSKKGGLSCLFSIHVRNKKSFTIE
jgi:hypothetical protein